MSWALLLLTLTYCKCSFSQFVVTQEASVTVPPGGTARLSCSRSGGSVAGGNYPSWYQQRPGDAPVMIVYSSGTSNNNARPSGTPARYSGSISGNAAYLTIAAAEAGDDTVYHCALYAGGGIWIFGGGTQMNVLSGDTKAPILTIFPPSQEEVDKNKATVVCLLQDFYPASLDVTWKVDGQTITSGVEKSRATKQSENNLFMASSYLSLSPVNWSAEKTVTCQVTHQGKTFEKSVKKSECV